MSVSVVLVIAASVLFGIWLIITRLGRIDKRINMAEYTDLDVPITCAECDVLIEGIPGMEEHVRTKHPQYSPKEIPEFVRNWADSVYDAIDAENAWRAEEFRRTGHDPMDDSWDDPS